MYFEGKPIVDANVPNESRRIFLRRSCITAASLALYLLGACKQAPSRVEADAAPPPAENPVTLNRLILEDGTSLILESGEQLILEV